MNTATSWVAGIVWLSTASLHPRPAFSQQIPDPSRGYSAEQALRLHRIFDLADWQVTKNEEYARYTLLRLPEFVRHAVIPRSGPVALLGSAPDPGVGNVVAETEELGKLAL